MKELAWKGFFPFVYFKKGFISKFHLPIAGCGLSPSVACMLVFMILSGSFIHAHMINNYRKANQVPFFVLQDEQAFIIII